MSEQPGAGGEPTPPEAPQEKSPEGPPEWMGPITERMNELGEQTGQMAEQIAGLYGAPEEYEEEAEPEVEPDPYDEDGELTPEGAQQIIDQRVDERLNSALSQRDAARALEAREDAFEALRDEIPALQDDKTAARLVREVAADLDAHGHEAVIETPLFVDLIEQRYKSEQFEQRASAEREQDPGREVVLESAAGGGAPSKSTEIDWGERIAKAAERLRPSI